MKTLMTIFFLSFITSSWAEETPIIDSGFYDTEAKQLIIKGPAAEAIWSQMANVEEKIIKSNGEVSGRSKESAGTICEKTLERPRPLARSILVTTCGISLNHVGE